MRKKCLFLVNYIITSLPTINKWPEFYSAHYMKPVWYVWMSPFTQSAEPLPTNDPACLVAAYMCWIRATVPSQFCAEISTTLMLMSICSWSLFVCYSIESYGTALFVWFMMQHAMMLHRMLYSGYYGSIVQMHLKVKMSYNCFPIAP